MVEINTEKTFTLADAAPMVACATSGQHSGTRLRFGANSFADAPTSTDGDVSDLPAWSLMA